MASAVRRFLGRFGWRVVQVALVLALGGFAYASTGSMRYATSAMGGVVVVIVAYSVFFGGTSWLLETASPIGRKTFDDRGRPTNISPIQWKMLELEMMERIMLGWWLRDNPPSRWRTSMRWIILVGWLAIWFGIHSVWHINKELNWILLLGISLPLMILIQRFFRRWDLRRQTPMLLAMGRCPVCTYDIKKLSAAEDRCTVCAECGAAWRMSSWKVMPEPSSLP
jgi:hypothetical protein